MADAQTNPGTEALWRQRLTQGHGTLKLLRAIFRRLPSEPRCKICKNPFGGIGGAVLSVFGYRPSNRNPNICTRCCEHLPPGGAEVEIAVLFADVRGSTGLAERTSPGAYAELLRRYYLVATRALIRRDAVIDKLIGDEVMALFIPGVAGAGYRRQAGLAAVDLLRAVGYGRGSVAWIPVGVGIHAGTAFVGNINIDYTVDFTALGDAVNTAARLRTVAKAGEVVMSREVYQAIADQFPSAATQTTTLRGKEGPIDIHTVVVGR
jgi:adenylate cyclase